MTTDHVVAPKHKHQWLPMGQNSVQITARCACGQLKKRKATKEETAKFNASTKKMFAQSKAMHTLWHKLAKEFTENHEWKLKGWDLIEELEKYQIENPKVRMVRVDDSMHMNSELVLVPHSYDTPKLGSHYWGTTVLYVAQCGDPPVSFFLYPGHLRNLIENLQAIEKEQAELNSRKKEKMLKPTKGKKPVCAPCTQGRHSSKGYPEYGDSDTCPDARCGCECRMKKLCACKAEEMRRG